MNSKIVIFCYIFCLKQDYYPYDKNTCSGGTPDGSPSCAKFTDFTAWHCEKGAEWVSTSCIKAKNFKMVNNEKAGIEVKMIKQLANNRFFTGPQGNGPTIQDTWIVGKCSTKYITP